MSDDNTDIIDNHHTACLCDVGQPDYIAATAVSADGQAHLVLARVDSLGDEQVRYDPMRVASNNEHARYLGAGLLLVPRCRRRVAMIVRADLMFDLNVDTATTPGVL